MALKPEQIEKFMTLESDKPFCLIVASHEPHGPHRQGGYGPDKIPMSPYRVDTPHTRQQLANYYTDIDLLDKEVGEVLGLLKKHNLEQNTLFVYASDHGYDIYAKWSCYDAGLHVPFIVRWPGNVKPGTVTDAMVNFVDVLPTFVEVAGAGSAGANYAKRVRLDALAFRKDVLRSYWTTAAPSALDLFRMDAIMRARL